MDRAALRELVRGAYHTPQAVRYQCVKREGVGDRIARALYDVDRGVILNQRHPKQDETRRGVDGAIYSFERAAIDLLGSTMLNSPPRRVALQGGLDAGIVAEAIWTAAPAAIGVAVIGALDAGGEATTSDGGRTIVVSRDHDGGVQWSASIDASTGVVVQAVTLRSSYSETWTLQGRVNDELPPHVAPRKIVREVRRGEEVVARTEREFTAATAEARPPATDFEWQTYAPLALDSRTGLEVLPDGTTRKPDPANDYRPNSSGRAGLGSMLTARGGLITAAAVLIGLGVALWIRRRFA